jgi:hypothetical protein
LFKRNRRVIAQNHHYKRENLSFYINNTKSKPSELQWITTLILLARKFLWCAVLGRGKGFKHMSLDSERGAEGGMIRALLGYQLINLSAEDLVIVVRPEGFLETMNQLKLEGWNQLKAIYPSDFEPTDQTIFLTYILRSETRIHRSLGIQVQLSPTSPWKSISGIFRNAEQIETVLTNQYGFNIARPD